jgi:hypothetical protein
MAHADLFRHAVSSQDVGLESERVQIVGRGKEVEFEIDQRRADIFDGGEALVEGARRKESMQQILRDGFIPTPADCFPALGFLRNDVLPRTV